VNANGTDRLRLGVVSALIFAFTYALNAATPLIADDYTFAFIFRTGRRVAGLADLFESQRVFYATQSGRVISGFLAQLSVLAGRPAFNVANTLMFLLLVWLIYAHATGLRRTRVSLLAVIPLLLWFAWPSFGQSALWIAGSTNYLWVIVLVLIALLPFRIHAESPGSVRDTIANAALIVPFAVLAGWTNEAIGPTAVLLMIAAAIFFKREHGHVPKWAFTGAAGSALGATLLLAAPGNWVNLAAQDASASQPALAVLAERLLAITHGVFLDNLFALAVVFAACAILARSFGGAGAPRVVVIGGAYLAAAFVATYAMTASPFFPARSWTGIIVFAVIAIGVAYSAIETDAPVFRRLVAVVVASLFIMFTVRFAYVYLVDLRTTQRQWSEREASIRAQGAGGGTDVVVPPLTVLTPYNAAWGLKDLDSDSAVWPNPDVARYFGVRSVRVADPAK